MVSCVDIAQTMQNGHWSPSNYIELVQLTNRKSLNSFSKILNDPMCYYFAFFLLLVCEAQNFEIICWCFRQCKPARDLFAIVWALYYWVFCEKKTGISSVYIKLEKKLQNTTYLNLRTRTLSPTPATTFSKHAVLDVVTNAKKRAG